MMDGTEEEVISSVEETSISTAQTATTSNGDQNWLAKTESKNGNHSTEIAQLSSCDGESGDDNLLLAELDGLLTGSSGPKIGLKTEICDSNDAGERCKTPDIQGWYYSITEE